MSGLCGNPDCGAFFDMPGVPYLDRDTKKAVVLCRQCATSVEVTRNTKYERLAIPPGVQPPEGASE